MLHARQAASEAAAAAALESAGAGGKARAIERPSKQVAAMRAAAEGAARRAAVQEYPLPCAHPLALALCLPQVSELRAQPVCKPRSCLALPFPMV